MLNRTLLAVALSLSCAATFAQTPVAGTAQRDAHQQARIESGLKDGSLTTREASTLERQEARVDGLQARDLRNGRLSSAERTRLVAAQDRVGNHIAAARQNGVTGSPTSRSSRRMQADVARNASQQQRIAAGVRDGSLTHREVSTLERGQARVDRREAAASAGGHIGKVAQRDVQRSENRQGARIARLRHDGPARG